jgi:hypothetical protein
MNVSTERDIPRGSTATWAASDGAMPAMRWKNS